MLDMRGNVVLEVEMQWNVFVYGNLTDSLTRRAKTPVSTTLYTADNQDYMQCYGVLRCVVEEQLFRSVEGQAASDEEEDKWTGDQRRQVDEVKRILSRLSCCGERYCMSTT